MTVNFCRICGGERHLPFLSRPVVPVHQNILLESHEEALGAPSGRLEMVVCEKCGFIFNVAFDPSLVEYGPKYENTQTHSAAFSGYVDSLVAEVVSALPQGGLLVEAGCGKGVFAERVMESAHTSTSGVGFDPSYVGSPERLGGRLRFEKKLYDGEASSLAADVVVCRHVIEHVPDPSVLALGIARAISTRPHARVFIETPDVDWILRNHVYWDFFYEHCSLFSGDSLAHVWQIAGLGVQGLRRVFSGQYLWLQAGAAEAPVPLNEVPRTIELAKNFGGHEARSVARWVRNLRELSQTGRVAVWGAGAKGVTFAHLADPDCSLVECLIDINPGKQNRFVPLTGHHVLSSQALVQRSISSVVVLNPNYLAEVYAEVERLSPGVRVVDGIQWLRGD